MAGEAVITVVGNLTSDIELRYTPKGAAQAKFTVAHNSKTFDKSSNQWKETDPLFISCVLWREYAEHAAETLNKGDRVIVHGNLVQKRYEEAGEKRTWLELHVTEIGPSLRFATAQITKMKIFKTNHPGTSQTDPWATT